MSDLVERARERLKNIKDDGDAVLIDMLVTYIERLEAECTPRWMQIAHEQREEIERYRDRLHDVACIAEDRKIDIEELERKNERLRAALGEIGALTAEPKLYDHEEGMSDRLDAIYKHVRRGLGDG